MYPPKFDYQRADSVEAALTAMQQGAKVLAGGHSLIPALKLRLSDPGTLVDIGRLDGMKGITVNGAVATIGALTTHAMVAKATNLPTALTEAAGMIGDPAVRNRGTVGGNIAHADPASDLPTVFVGLGATINLIGPNGSRSVAAADFFIDLFYTALEEDELVASVDVPLDGAGSAYVKLFNPASRYAIVGACAKVSVAGGVCTAATVAIGGLTPSAKQAPSVAAALVGQALNADTINVAAAAVAGDLGEEVMGDIHASEEYRRAMAPVYVARALSQAAERA
jgi:carbon-monoxide dehydrogenase medium subunit